MFRYLYISFPGKLTFGCLVNKVVVTVLINYGHHKSLSIPRYLAVPALITRFSFKSSTQMQLCHVEGRQFMVSCSFSCQP